MRYSKWFSTLGLISALASGGLAIAAEQGLPPATATEAEQGMPAAAAEPGALEIKDYQGIAYVSGGVGEEERQFLNSIAKQFNLKLLFAVAQGNYLSNVDVAIQNAKKETVLEAVSEGPYFYAELPPGNYTVLVSGPGQEFRRSVRVGKGRQSQLSFYWK